MERIRKIVMRDRESVREKEREGYNERKTKR